MVVFKALFIVWLRWMREDTSNMAVIDVKLVSGYQVDEESLDLFRDVDCEVQDV